MIACGWYDQTKRTHVSDAVDGIDRDSVSGWFARNVSDVQLPLDITLIAGGHSNLTYSIGEQPAADGAAGRCWVLRRPPLGQVLATAHDVVREHRIIAALAGSAVPVPRAVGVSSDDSVNGAPFYVMDFVDGRVIRTAEDAADLSPEVRTRTGESLIDVLAAIHSVDVDKVGLGDLARREDYVARQLKRWYGQFERTETQVEGGLNLPAVHDLHDLLRDKIPEQIGSTIVHGDYRLDNCMIDSTGEVVAVLDWEICTLGDPLADLGLLWVYWTDEGEQAVLPQSAPTTLGGFPTKVQLMERYENESGRDLSDLPFYVAFGYWKLTCILAGVYARYAGGAMGSVPESTVEGFRSMLDTLVTVTESAAGNIGSNWRGRPPAELPLGGES